MKRPAFNLCFLMAAFFLAALLVFSSCKKDFSRHAAVMTNEVDKPTATAHGNIIDMGKDAIKDHGFCWDTLGTPSYATSKITLGGVSQTGQFQGQILSLLPNRVYYLKAFVAYDEDVIYGDMISFTTPDLPTIITAAITNITTISATSGGDITSDGGSLVTSRGVCWSANPNPDLSVNHTTDSSGTGVFISAISALTEGTKYYVRSYATNYYGTRYGNEVNFIAGQGEDIPIIATTEASNIGMTTATSGGEVISDGGLTVTERGVCWSTTPYPTTADGKTSDGSGTGIFISNLSGLTANTTYYIRAYAVNEKGTGYGEDKSFTTQKLPDLPTVITATITDITTTSAISGGTVLDNGGSPVTVRGVCWSTNPNPTTNDNKTTDGSGTGTFVSTLTGLTPDQKYYVRAYATNNAGTAYGNEINFTAGQIITAPTVTTTEVVNVTQTTATCGGNVTSDGGATVTARGVCWSTNPNPTLSDNHTSDGTGTGGFLSSLTSLTSGTAYHVRAYATNSAGTSYGNERTFTTLGEPTVASVTTAPVTNITNNSAQSGGTVTNDGGSSVSARGVCWSTGYNPTINDPHTHNGTGIGSYISNMTGLLANTFYRVRAYATNAVGTAYGNQLTFSTLQDPILPTVTTIEAINITQTTATTGGKVMSDGGADVTERGVCYSTNPNPTLANPHTSDGSGTGTFISNLSGLTPGTLYYVRAYAINSIGTSYGNEILFTTLTTAILPTVTTNTVTDITQTSATSGGNVTSDGGSPATARGVCWSTSSNPTTTDNHTTDGSGTGTFISYLTGLTPNTLYYVRAYGTNNVGTGYGNEVAFTTGQNITSPIVITASVTDIAQTTATSGGTITSDGGAPVTARGVCWSISSNPTIADSYTNDGTGTGTFTSYLTGLTPNTLYYVRAYATNSIGTSYGNEVTFTTLNEPQPCPGVPTVIYEGKTYNTVQIGTQCWFKENLNVGTRINGSQNPTNNGIKEKYCYNDLESNCDVYGGLYQWYEMMQYVTTQGVQGLCPSGWHIPTDGEWTILTDFLGGESVAGTKMKSTSGWYGGGNGNNSSGFTALPGGSRYPAGWFGDLTQIAYFWSSSINVTSANDRILRYNYDNVQIGAGYLDAGFSIRCIKN